MSLKRLARRSNGTKSIYSIHVCVYVSAMIVMTFTFVLCVFFSRFLQQLSASLVLNVLVGWSIGGVPSLRLVFISSIPNRRSFPVCIGFQTYSSAIYIVYIYIYAFTWFTIRHKITYYMCTTRLESRR